MNILTIGPHIQGMHRSQIKERIGTCMTTLAAEYKNKRMWFYTIKTESEEYGKKAFEKIQQDKHFIKNLLEEIKQCAEKTYVLGQQLQKKQWKLTKEEKCNVFDELYENHAHACMLGYVTVVADLENQLLTDNAFNKLNKAVEKTRSKKSTNEYFAVLTTITEDTIIQKEKLALLEVAKKIQKNNINKSQQQKELEKIHQKYCWANFGYNGPAKTIEEYEQELRIILEKDAEKELKTAQKEKEEITHQQKQFEKELELTSDELYAIECVKDTTITKLIRKDFIAYSCYLFHLLLEETRKQYNLTVEELQHLTPHEARNILRGDLKPNKQELQKRIEHCVYIYNNEKEKMLYDSEGEQFIKNNIFEERIEQASELKGMAAYLGKVQGRAVIVNTKADIQKISEGDILISYATSPEILPAMKKASAFVTDHGGATCHAAIVAREMKKPCIIGTKYATKVFKDDDIIEVDAHTGIVKTIEKKEATKEKYEWKEFASDFNSPLMRNHLWTKSWIAQAKIFDLPFVEIGVKGEKNTIEYIAKIETWFNAHNILRKRVESNPKWVESLIFKTNQLGEETNAWSEKVFAEEKLQAYTAEELCTLLNEFIEKQGLLYAYGTLLPVLDFQGFSYVEGTLKKILQEKMPAEYAEAYKVFTAPAYNSFQQDQEEELLQLMNEYYTKEWKNDINSLNEQEIQKKHSQFWKRLEQHTKKHAWVYYVYQGPSFTETNFLEFISQHLKKEKTPQEQLEQIQKNKKEIEKKKVKYLEKIKPTAFEKNILLLTGIVVWGKPRRKDYQSKTYYHAEYFYREIAKRVQCSLQEARFADPELLKNALRTNTTIDKKHCEDSYNFHVVIPKNSEEIEIFVGKEAEEFYKKVEKEKKCEGGKTEINGSCACPGTATGTVKIINSPEDMHKMQQGDILVSVATTPSIVPAMKKAAAIITNEGGITCHASIVSRELNIPCIVGTKYATQILQDEDFVEVDATHGIIKIQNKKKYIAWFNEVNNTNVLLVGGKGASLGEMYSIMPVPNGFCITVDAYKEAIQPILHEINEILNKKSQTIEELNQKEKAIQAKIYAIEIPQRIQERIKQEYKKLGGNVAVRSSATTEDLEDASFAGQQDTYLNITGESAVLEAVKKCWASLFNARAIQYREEKGFKHEDAYLAVVIQCMIDADAAGVLFTANPVNNSRKEIILEACSGLGEKLVSGEITPDTYIIQKETEEIIQEIISGEQRIISKETVQEIVQLGKEIEKHYKKPMDIEWAIKDNKIHILQARPITTLEQEAKEKWITNFSIEYCGSQLIHPALETAFTRSMDILFDKRHVKRFLAIMDGIHLKNACVKETEIQEFVDAIINKIINEPITIKRIHTEAYVYNDAYINTAKKYINKDFSKIRDAKLAEIYQTLLDAQNKGHAQALTTTWFVDSYQEKFSKWLLEKTEEITQNKDIAETFSILTTSARNSLALQEEIESMKIVAMIEECSEKDKILNWQNPSEMPECSIKNIMEAHYQKWRWMPFAYMGPAYEREYYLEVWKGLVRENINPKKRIRELEQRPEIIKKQKQEIIKKLNIDKEMQTIYEIAADITFLKGYRKEAMYHGMFALSYILKEIAIRLHIHYKGMYLLTPYEISEALINKAPIDSTALYERKGKHCFVYNYEKNSVEEYRGKEAEEFLSTQEFIIEEIKETDTLKGTTACAGYTKGIVKIINHPADMSKMNENNILVAHKTMPSLLPAMKKASAIITEDGGITCHAAIVSRELKIPCVTGIKNATKVLKDNDIIEVDANQGIVRIIP